VTRAEQLEELRRMREILEADALDELRKELIHELRNIEAVLAVLEDDDAEIDARVVDIRARYNAWAHLQKTQKGLP
jgi:hypothetical protein